MQDKTLIITLNEKSYQKLLSFLQEAPTDTVSFFGASSTQEFFNGSVLIQWNDCDWRPWLHPEQVPVVDFLNSLQLRKSELFCLTNLGEELSDISSFSNHSPQDESLPTIQIRRVVDIKFLNPQQNMTIPKL